MQLPKYQAGEALQALRKTKVSSRRFYSTNVQHTVVHTEPSPTSICEQCRGKASSEYRKDLAGKVTDTGKKSESEEFLEIIIQIAVSVAVFFAVVQYIEYKR